MRSAIGPLKKVNGKYYRIIIEEYHHLNTIIEVPELRFYSDDKQNEWDYFSELRHSTENFLYETGDRLNIYYEEGTLEEALESMSKLFNIKFTEEDVLEYTNLLLVYKLNDFKIGTWRSLNERKY